MKVWKMIALFDQVMFKFPFNFPGCGEKVFGWYLLVVQIPSKEVFGCRRCHLYNIQENGPTQNILKK